MFLKKGNDMKRLLKATLIVTLFSVLTRALGFVLRIILSRFLGAEMLGYYQVSMSILGVLMTLVASGIPLVISRNVAFKKAQGDIKSAYKSVSAGLIVSLFISVGVSLVIYLFPEILNFIFKQNKSTTIVFYLLPSLIFSAVYCTLRSALWGEKHFFAISFTEFFEQVVRIILCFILFYFPVLSSLSFGEKAGLSLSIACLFSALLVVFIYFGLKKKLNNPRGQIKSLIKSSMPITMLRTVSSLVQSIISVIIPLRLVHYGFSHSEAMAEFGTIMGMAFPLIMIPGTLISSLAVTIIPEISSETDNIDKIKGVKDLSRLKSHINLSINMTVLISAILLPVFIVLGGPICKILFKSELAGKYVSIASILMLPMGVSQITSSILNSIGLEIKSLINYGVGAIALFISIYFLPKYMGTNALIVGMGSLWTITMVLNLVMLKKRNLLEKTYLKTIGLVIFFGLVGALACYLVYNLFIRFTTLLISTCIAGVIGVGFMFGLYYVFNIAGFKGFLITKKRKVVS